MGKPKAQKMIVRPSGKNEECINKRIKSQSQRIN